MVGFNTHRIQGCDGISRTSGKSDYDSLLASRDAKPVQVIVDS
jgi:hypothetical protein